MCAFVYLYSWKPPRYIMGMPPARHDRVRKKYHILVDGEAVPPPIKSFREMKLPQGKRSQTFSSHVTDFCG